MIRGGFARSAAGWVLALVAASSITAAAAREKPMAFTLHSSFKPNGEIPRTFTADGKDVSPPLSWSGAPSGTRSLALIVDDPDAPDPAAPRMVWVHWVLYDIPAATSSLPQAAKAGTLPEGTREGLNDWKRPGYRGPAPPIGRHHYVFKLYALDDLLPDLGDATKADVEKAMQGHVLARAELIGTYARH